MISVVCPFFNEDAVLDKAIILMTQNLSRLTEDWELLLVNDGSTDKSEEIAQKHSRRNKNIVTTA